VSLRDARKKRRPEVNLEMTPLIDVVFLLLIFFLITTTFSKSQEAHIPINLPTAVTGEKASSGDKVVLFITEDGTVDLKGDQPLQGETLEDKLKNLHSRSPGASVVLKGDEKATHGKVIEVLDRIKETGFKKVDLVISRPSGGK
jgi:biopolymer transport protein ExbD